MKSNLFVVDKEMSKGIRHFNLGRNQYVRGEVCHHMWVGARPCRHNLEICDYMGCMLW